LVLLSQHHFPRLISFQVPTVAVEEQVGFPALVQRSVTVALHGAGGTYIDFLIAFDFNADSLLKWFNNGQLFRARLPI
jgi:hypothetical protein